ncbi:hypothetical protein G6F55_011706 [Rhizopus delemar]|nr:hypothetical protein G6F55_011706 [Rhizopus delemar]KAG1537190.1 hypothetical protein G6F51_010517 [Rhizopus arrhizus]KAG1488910.1 hypothetical protein G6F54_011812 [Rhizopus delemar]KAG1548575.1 hypothetical protein G6F49_009860 [Rhizopus delemar]KAG1563406.1 hypothetical protein G6F50_011985 [Rhizopus delemar]
MSRCSIALDANTSNNFTTNSSSNLTPTTSSSNRSADAPVASITGLNNHKSSTNLTNINLNVTASTTASAGDNLSVTSSENIDDWNEDIEMAKTKIKNQIKRKLQEIEVLRKE